MSARRASALGAATLVLLLIWVGGLLEREVSHEEGRSSSRSEPRSSAVTPAELHQLLAAVKVVDGRPEVPGYDRECGTAHACSFGQAWTDDSAGELGHNGCGTRDDVLSRDLTDVTYRSGTHSCVVVSGVLMDPYTGERIAFTKDEAHEVGIDHLYPLARAWDLGAAQWDQQRRTDFANDSANLLAVSGRANSSKGDRGPGEWMPINAAHRCDYVAGYLEVAIAYDLPVTAADHDAVLAASAGGC